MDAAVPVGYSGDVAPGNHQTATGHPLTHNEPDCFHVYFVSEAILYDALLDPATMYKVIRSLHIDPEHSEIITVSSRGIDRSLKESPSFLQSILEGSSTPFYAASRLPGVPAIFGGPGRPVIVYLVTSHEVDNALEKLATSSGLLHEKNSHVLRVCRPQDKAEPVHVQIFTILSNMRVGAGLPDIRSCYKFPQGYLEGRRAEVAVRSWRRPEATMLRWFEWVVRISCILYVVFVTAGVLNLDFFGSGIAISAMILRYLGG